MRGRALVLLIAAGCNGPELPASEASSSSTGPAPELTSTGVPSTSVAATDDDGGTTGADTPAGLGGECSIWEQDCDAGEKCVPWSKDADLVPDEVRCCPVSDAPKQVGDPCLVDGYFGSCLDDCDTGSLCLDTDGDGEGTCHALCGNNPSQPTCGTDETCFVYFDSVPLCFPTCNPLAQDCGEGWGCYPDSAAAGGTGFMCLPTVGTAGAQGDICWLLSNCQPGFLCVRPQFLPVCDGDVGCCTAFCDTSLPDLCRDHDEALECIPWYYAGEDPPFVELQNVGACVLPP